MSDSETEIITEEAKDRHCCNHTVRKSHIVAHPFIDGKRVMTYVCSECGVWFTPDAVLKEQRINTVEER